MARKRVLSLLMAAFLIAGASVAVAQASTHGRSHRHDGDHGQGGGAATATPIKHVVVIFQENVSFDHYFGTYPNAANTDGQRFHASPRHRHRCNGLSSGAADQQPEHGRPNTANPQRLSLVAGAHVRPGPRLQRRAAGLRHGPDGQVRPVHQTSRAARRRTSAPPNLVMDYYDGNTVTALWNYAQHFAMSDNSFSTTFGPSTPGALNLISGQTTRCHDRRTSRATSTTARSSAIRGRSRPTTIARSRPRPQAAMSADERRRSAQRQGRHLGLVPGRLQADVGRERHGRVLPRATRTSAEHRSPTTSPTTSRSSTTPRPPIRTTCRRPRWR